MSIRSEDAAALQALMEGVDQAMRQAEAEWGIERLPLLVCDDLRVRFRRQQTKWREALEAAWTADVLTRGMLDEVALHAGGMQRACAALSAAATEAGHRPIAPWVWEVRLKDGKVAALVQTNAEASKVIADGRHVAVYTLEEVGNVIDSLGAIGEAKFEWPGTKVRPARDYAWVEQGDELPF